MDRRQHRIYLPQLSLVGAPHERFMTALRLGLENAGKLFREWADRNTIITASAYRCRLLADDGGKEGTE